MIESKDLEAIKKICEEIESFGFEKPRVTMFGATNEDFSVNLAFSKIASQTPKEGT